MGRKTNGGAMSGNESFTDESLQAPVVAGNTRLRSDPEG
jgi:hypothetical protein